MNGSYPYMPIFSVLDRQVMLTSQNLILIANVFSHRRQLEDLALWHGDHREFVAINYSVLSAPDSYRDFVSCHSFFLTEALGTQSKLLYT